MQPIQLTSTTYTLDYVDRNAVSWIGNAPRDQPIFAFLTPFAPHYADQEGTDEDPTGVLTVHQPSPDTKYLSDPRCQGIPDWNPPNYNEPDVSDKPAFIRALPPVRQYPTAGRWIACARRCCPSTTSSRDVQSAMTAAGRTNVLYIFTNDNGMTWGAHRWSKKHVPYATPLPLFMRWDLEFGGAPSQVDETVQNIDLAPTLCAVAGCTLGPFANGHGVDGMSILPALIQHEALDRQYVYEEYPLPGPDGMPAWWGVRTTNENTLGAGYSPSTPTANASSTTSVQDPWELHNRCNQPIYSTIQGTLAQQVADFRARCAGRSIPEGAATVFTAPRGATRRMRTAGRSSRTGFAPIRCGEAAQAGACPFSTPSSLAIRSRIFFCCSRIRSCVTLIVWSAVSVSWSASARAS